MRKVAYITLTYSFSCSPKDVELDNTCSKREMEEAIDNYLDKLLNEMDMPEHMPPDIIEVDLYGWEV